MRSRDSYIGRVFGNYQIKSRIACGSFGCVYFAEHIWLPRNAAIKLLHRIYLNSSKEQEKFHQEAQILEELRHRHIVRIYEFGVEKGFPFLVTEYASNGSLHELLKQDSSHPLPIDYIVSILSQIGDALYFANQQGILHHDLKPANILFNSEDQVLLADFGIAIVQLISTVTCPAATKGTPTYMAPEQFLGSVGPKSDQYSLGCIAYELVTGRPPFIASNPYAIGHMHIKDTPIPPRQFNPNLPLHIEQAILKALEKQSINRHVDIASFVKALSTPISQMPQTYRKTAERQLNEALKLIKLKYYEQALAASEQAIQLNPNYVAAYKVKGALLYKLNRNEEALAVYIQVIQLASNDSDAWRQVADILYKLKRYEEALAAYVRISQLDPENAINFYNIGNALKSLGWIKEAQQAYEKAHTLWNKK